MSNLILASGSDARKNMLQSAGVEFDVIKAELDEERIIAQNKDILPEEISTVLAKEKALGVSKKNTGAIVIGSDQVLLMDNKIYSKAKNKEEAFERLKEFSGQEHVLSSSVAVYKNSEILFSFADTAYLKMKNLEEATIKSYIEQAGDVVTQCVGCYALEGLGSRLFQKVKGDYFTILGMPLLPLLSFLEEKRYISL